MKLSGQEIVKTQNTVFSAEVECPWCNRVASIDIGPQHRNGLVDYHCQKCSRFSSHTVKTADKWFDQHTERLKKDKEVWKRIPPEAYVTCRRSATSGASFVYTLYTGKGSPKEFLSRDSVEYALIDEFGMSWEQANALLISAGLGSHGGQRVYLRQLTKISAALEERRIQAENPRGFQRGDVVKINDREALFLRHSSEGFSIVAFPGVGDAEVPTVDLEIVDAGDTPAEVGFDDFVMDSPEEEMFEAETTDDVLMDVEHVTQHVREVLEHEKMEGDESEEISALEDAVDSLEDASEAISDFVGNEYEEAGGELEEHGEHHEEFSEEPESHEESEEKEAHRVADANNEKFRALYNIINDPETDPATLQEAQRQLNSLKQQQSIAPQTVGRPLANRKTAWWYKAPWELEHMERPDQISKAPSEEPLAEQSDLYPKVNDLYSDKIERSDKAEESSNDRGTVIANRMTQQKVHQAYNRTGDLKQALTWYRSDLSIVDIREVLSFYKTTGKIAGHEADDLARWFIGTKPRLLSARQVRGTITGGPGSYHVKSEEGKNLGGPYKTRDQAKKRLQQVEYFKHKGSNKTAACTCEGAYDRYCPEHGAQESRYPRANRVSLSKKALLDKGMGIFQPAVYRGKEVLVIAIDNTGNRATVEDGQKRQFQVDVADLTPSKTGPYTGKGR